jgi:hypothetical protein
MTRLTIELVGTDDPDVWQDWPEVDQSLEPLGFSVEVRSRRPRRAAPSEGLEILVRLLDSVETHALDALVGALVAAVSMRLSQIRQRERRASLTIFGPDGKPLKKVSVPPGEEDDRRS